ncbi:MAG: ribosome-associated translation inhibitor RaiA [Bacilli bacterium]
MKLNIRGDKVVVTKSIKEYITEKVSKLDKYFESPAQLECKVLIKVKNFEQSIEITVLTSKFTLRAEERNEDLYAAIDLVVDKLESQIRKQKNRVEAKYKNQPTFEMNFDFEVEEDEEEIDEKIVKRKDIEMKPMDEEEAVIQMELLNHDFFVFKNITEECVSVIYKRKDKSFGIINVK